MSFTVCGLRRTDRARARAQAHVGIFRDAQPRRRARGEIKRRNKTKRDGIAAFFDCREIFYAVLSGSRSPLARRLLDYDVAVDYVAAVGEFHLLRYELVKLLKHPAKIAVFHRGRASERFEQRAYVMPAKRLLGLDHARLLGAVGCFVAFFLLVDHIGLTAM